MSEPIHTLRTTPLHPARRRLIIAVVLWVLLVRTGLGIAAEWLQLTEITTFGLVTALFLALFLPLSLAAVGELNAARVRGDEQLPQIPTRASLVGFGVFTLLLWVAFMWGSVQLGQLVFPLLPVLGTIWVVVGVVRFRRAGEPLEVPGAEPARDRMNG